MRKFKNSRSFIDSDTVTTTILIIDDAVHIRRLITRMLQLSGFETLEAADGLQGVNVLKEQKPDIVTCDIAMPNMDGYGFVKAARENPETQDVPIIMLTATGQEEEVVKAMALGANAYLTKPFSSSRLLEIIYDQLEH
jgi:CheY-like chemotaxis protein